MEFHLPFHLYLNEYRFKHLALYHALRDAIVSGAIAYGTKLPSSREMADLYVLSRGIVNQVYEMLFAEGYVEAVVGKGTFVAFHNERKHEKNCEKRYAQLSDWGKRINHLTFQGHVKRLDNDLKYDFQISRSVYADAQNEKTRRAK
ncbi:GntR family transcriptional regulator [Brevibacillus sp. SYSU BS000544]|uniref:GntR family transcriptional regulator n=1 Tax=Brevibacillus sp. SYSU BS000544 TaxID=3416443 RepID=UPI003CE45103